MTETDLKDLTTRLLRRVSAREGGAEDELYGLVYDVLHELSRTEGRKDRWRGVELAELAVVSLEANREDLGDAFHGALAVGVAWVGNQERLALNPHAAAAHLEKAAGLVAEHPELAPGVDRLMGEGRLASTWGEADELFAGPGCRRSSRSGVHLCRVSRSEYCV